MFLAESQPNTLNLFVLLMGLNTWHLDYSHFELGTLMFSLKKFL